MNNVLVLNENQYNFKWPYWRLLFWKSSVWVEGFFLNADIKSDGSPALIFATSDTLPSAGTLPSDVWKNHGDNK